jgi:hypothetical protein
MNQKSLDRAAVRRLRRGVVASSHIVPLTVGAEPLVNEVRGQFQLLSAGMAQACFIDGEWGTGKTHLLALTRRLALDDGHATAYLNLNGQSAALNHPQRFYHLIATRIRTVEGTLGLPSLIGRWAARDETKTALTQWAGANEHRSELAGAVGELVRSFGKGDFAPMHAWSVVMGADLVWADYGYKREKALGRISDLGECLAALGMGGLVLELDELETLEQLWNYRSRLGAYSILGRLVAMNHVLPFFAVTDRFRWQIDSDIRFRGTLNDPGLSQSALRFLEAWIKERFPKLRPVVMTPALARTLVGRIVDLYEGCYGPLDGVPDPQEVVRSWAGSPVRSPRTLIRRAVFQLDLIRNNLYG